MRRREKSAKYGLGLLLTLKVRVCKSGYRLKAVKRGNKKMLGNIIEGLARIFRRIFQGI